ncbi:D-amino acid aminotransferase [soil metagenome]
MIARIDGVPATAVSLADRGVLHGDSVYELVRVARGKPFLLAWHDERLHDGISRFRFGDADHVLARVQRDTRAVLSDVGARDGVLRIVVTRGEGALRAPLASLEPRTIVVWGDLPAVLGRRLRLGVVDSPRASADAPAAVAKYARYLPYLLAGDDARARGVDDALLLDEQGNVAETAAANVFAVVAGVLVTPSRATGVLAGIMRRWVIEHSALVGAAIEERTLTRSELASASEVFVTSSVRGIVSVSAIDDVGYSAAPIVADRLRTLLTRAMA